MNWFENLNVQELKVDYAEISAAYADRLRREIIKDLVEHAVYRADIGPLALCFCKPIVDEFKAAGFAVTTKPISNLDGGYVEQGLRVVIAFKQEPSV